MLRRQQQRLRRSSARTVNRLPRKPAELKSNDAMLNSKVFVTQKGYPMNRIVGTRLTTLIALACLVLLSACASKPMFSPPVSPVIPQAATLPVSLQEPPSQQNFSNRAKVNTEAWQQKLSEFESKP